MNTNKNNQIPNIVVYGVLYVTIFGISIWLLEFRNESPTNWILYIAMATAFLAGLVKLALGVRKRYEPSLK